MFQPTFRVRLVSAGTRACRWKTGALSLDPTVLFYVRSPSFSFRASEGAFPAGKALFALAKAVPMVWGVLPIPPPRQLPALRHAGCAKVLSGRRRVWPWLKPWLQAHEQDGGTRRAEEPVGTSRRHGVRKIPGSQLVQLGPKPTSYGF